MKIPCLSCKHKEVMCWRYPCKKCSWIQMPSKWEARE